MIEVSLYESDVEVLKSIAHGNALFSGGFGDWDPKTGLSLLIGYREELLDEVETLEQKVKELEGLLPLLEDIADRYYAVMNEINCDFEDMFPEWGKE